MDSYMDFIYHATDELNRAVSGKKTLFNYSWEYLTLSMIYNFYLMVTHYHKKIITIGDNRALSDISLFMYSEYMLKHELIEMYQEIIKILSFLDTKYTYATKIDIYGQLVVFIHNKK